MLPGQPQPGQKWFETLLLLELERFDPARPVFVEAESRKIGRLHVPDALIERIRAGECLSIDATLAARVAFLLTDYDYFLRMPELLSERLMVLKNLISRKTMERWHEMIAVGEWPSLVRALLEEHYDPLYYRSQNHNFAGHGSAGIFPTADLSTAGIADIAARIVHSRTAQIA